MRITGEAKAFRPVVQMGRMSGGGEDRSWLLRIEDETSGVSMIELRITDAELGAILGTSHTELSQDVPLMPTQYVGKVREHKTIAFDDPAPELYSRDARELQIKAAKSYESDGWIYSNNHHSQGFVKDGKVHAKYIRFVDPT